MGEVAPQPANIYRLSCGDAPNGAGDGPQVAQRGDQSTLPSTSRMTQQEGQEESDQQEDRNEWFVNWSRPG